MRTGQKYRKNRRRLLGMLLPLLLVAAILAGIMIHAARTRLLQMRTEELLKTPLPAGEVNPSMDDVPDEYLDEDTLEGTLVRFTYPTAAYDEDGRDMSKYAIVYVPYGYDPEDADTRYPVLYLMHGHGGNAETFLGSPGDPRDMKAVLDHLIAKRRMQPMLIVSASYYPDNEETDSDNYDADRTYTFARELREDLIPAFEGEFNTYAETTDEAGLRASRDYRAFGGFSMGGVTTWYRLADSLDYFRYFVPLSGSLLWGWQETFETSPRTNPRTVVDYLTEALDESGYGPEDFYIFSAVGTEDFAHDTLNLQIDMMRERPDWFRFENGEESNIVFFNAEGEEHDYHAKRRYLYNALPVIAGLMRGGKLCY